MATDTIYSNASTLEADSAENSSTSDVDSAFGDDARSTRTQSVTSSVYEYRYEHGRRYHAYRDGAYLLPNDDNEQDRLDLQHHLFRLALRGDLHIAPVPKDIHNVLDVGTGTGIWAMDFADEYPSARVLGIDLSPIQPIDVPPNCSFLVDDAEAEWLFDEKFDLIHSRAMIGGFKNWPKFFQQAFNNLNPGGYIELQEFCLPAKQQPNASGTIVDSKMVAWSQNVTHAGARLRLNMQAPLQFERQLRDAGFVDIHIKWMNWPCGPWAKGERNKALGSWCLADFLDGVDSSKALYTRVLGWSAEEFEVMAMEIKNEMTKRYREVKVYYSLCFCYARKPEEPTLAPDIPSSAPSLQDSIAAPNSTASTAGRTPSPPMHPAAATNQAESALTGQKELALPQPADQTATPHTMAE